MKFTWNDRVKDGVYDGSKFQNLLPWSQITREFRIPLENYVEDRYHQLFQFLTKSTCTIFGLER